MNQALRTLFVFAMLLTGTGHAQNIASGLVGYYPFNGNAGDSSNASPLNHGTVSGADYTCGLNHTQAIQFDSIVDYVELDSNFYMDTTFSVSLWVNPYVYQASSLMSLRYQCSTTGGWGLSRFYLGLSGNNTAPWWTSASTYANLTAPNQVVLVNFRANSSCDGFYNGYAYTVPGVSIDTNCFSHIVVVAQNNNSNSSRNFTIYINGTYYADVTYNTPSGSNLSNTVDPFNSSISNFSTYLGIKHLNNNSVNQAPLTGTMDELRVYNRALTAAEVQQLYQMGLVTDSAYISGGNNVLCPGELDTLFAHGTDSCDIRHWILNGNIVGTDSSYVMTGTGGTDTLLFRYRRIGRCISDTFMHFFNPPSPVMDTTVWAICPADSVLFFGQWYNQLGFYSDSSDYCDSIHVLQLLAAGAVTDTVFDTACYGTSVFVGGALQTTPGLYVDSMTTFNGCDSLLVTNLSFYNETLSFTDTVCSGGSVVIRGISYSTAGTWVYTDSTGTCDTIVTVSVTLLPPPDDTVQLQLCSGDSALVGGAFQTTSGLYIDTLSASNGCDSVVFTDLSFYYDTLSYADSICSGGAVTIRGITYNTGGTWTYTDYTGICDTIIIVSVTASAAFLDTHQVIACIGESVFVGGSAQTLTGFYLDTFQSVAGCDSVVVTDLQFQYALDTVMLFGCPNSTVLFNGQQWGVPGIYFDTLVVGSCSTQFLIQATSISFDTTNVSMTACWGAEVEIGGVLHSTPGVYSEVFQSQDGCDSVVRVTLFFEYDQVDTIDIQLCQGQSIQIGGNVITSSGYYAVVEPGPCDILHYYHVDIVPPTSSIRTISACAGSSVFVGGANQTEAGYYVDTLAQTGSGCDSIVTTALQFYYVRDTIPVTLCQGEIYGPSGVGYEVPTFFLDTVMVNGCEVARAHDIKLVSRATSVFDTTICEGQQVMIDGIWRGDEGTYTDTLRSLQTGCDSVRYTTLRIGEPQLADTNIRICAGDSVWVMGGFRNTSGTWTDTLASTNQAFCAYVRRYIVSISEDSLWAPHITVIDTGDCPDARTTVSAGVPAPGIRWSNDQTSEEITLQDSGMVYVWYDHCGYTQLDSTFVPIRDCSCRLYYPNAFTPNQNGLNEQFKPVFDCPIYYYHLLIYNRWGGLVMNTNDKEVWWDGNYKGAPVPDGVYTFVLHYNIGPNAPSITEYGRVTVVR